MIDRWCEEKAVLPIQTLIVLRVAPRLAMAGDKMLWIVHVSDPTGFLDQRDAIPENTLPASRFDQGISICLSDLRVHEKERFEVLFPFLDVSIRVPW